MVLEIFEDAVWEEEWDYGGKSVLGTSVWRWGDGIGRGWDGMGDGMKGMKVGGLYVEEFEDWALECYCWKV